MREDEHKLLGGRYQLQAQFSRGDSSIVYRGRDIHMKRDVAIKVLREVYKDDPERVARFQRQAKVTSGLHYSNIVQVYDYGQADGEYYIVMELIEGTDLRHYLRSHGILGVELALIIAQDIAQGLGAAHLGGTVHGGVSPQHVLISYNGSAKLIAFGTTWGQVHFYAPEQAQGEMVTYASDVYALGVVMYAMLTGHGPFDGDTPVAIAMQHIHNAPNPPSQINPSIPPSLEAIILRCLEKVPERRYRDGSELAHALDITM